MTARSQREPGLAAGVTSVLRAAWAALRNCGGALDRLLLTAGRAAERRMDHRTTRAVVRLARMP